MGVFEIEPRKEIGLKLLKPRGLQELWAYAQAYRHTANALVEAKEYVGSGSPDYSSFPIAYLYRHSLELLLKSILCSYHPRYRKEPAALLNQRSHKFDRYWGELRETIDGTPVDIPHEEWKQLEEVLKSWQKRDPDSMVFRYSVKKDGKTELMNPFFTFNVPALADAMETALEILTQLASELASFENDMTAAELGLDREHLACRNDDEGSPH